MGNGREGGGGRHAHVRLVLVVPAALVVPERKRGRHKLRADEPRVLLLHARWSFGREEEHVDHTGLREPAARGRFSGFVTVISTVQDL